MLLLFALCWQPVRAQDAAQEPVEKPVAKSAEKPAALEKAENPAQIELLETKIRFETNGDSRKEVHALVKINSEIGVRQFARLNFDFNRSFESVEIPLVHITHVSGGTADILPSAITDQPNPAVVNYPAYQDVRVKSVRILGLEPGDTLEYRVIKTVSHHPLAPDFWLDHTFDRSGVVTQEVFEIDLPVIEQLQMRIAPATPATSTEKLGAGNSARTIYRWNRSQADASKMDKSVPASEPDLLLTTFVSWQYLSEKLEVLLTAGSAGGGEVAAKAAELTRNSKNRDEKLEAIYEFVAQKIATVDLPLGCTGFQTKSPTTILSAGYGSPEDKSILLRSLSSALGTRLASVLGGAPAGMRDQLAVPSRFTRILTTGRFWLDPAVEVAPYGLISTDLRGKDGLQLKLQPQSKNEELKDMIWPVWIKIPDEPPFRSFQNVRVSGALAADGKLTAKVKYVLRGDNELVLRMAFHQTPKEKWKELAQLLSITDGFRGQVSSVNASDPYATKEPFKLDYELEQPKFVDWSKKTVRIPALLPQLGLPEPAGKPAAGAAASPIDLGTPLEVETEMSLHLPPGTTATTPTGTSVQRDYATYASQYAAKGQTVTASRHIHFLLREVPAARAADYNAFLRAVQNDEAQYFSLEKIQAVAAEAKPVETKTLPSKRASRP